MINTPNINEARKQIQKLKKENKEIIVQAQNDEFNRKILENKDVDMIIGLGFHDRKDKLKQRDSGLNEVLCKLAKKNSIKIGIDIKEIQKLDKKYKAIILARIMQNINLCKRTGAELVIMGNYDKKNAFSFLIVLGASTEMAKRAVC